MTALVATVEPWNSVRTLSTCPSSASSRPAITARAGSSGVEGTLWVRISPAPSSQMRSVKVPPTSIATSTNGFS
jgi:hypothetical protein